VGAGGSLLRRLLTIVGGGRDASVVGRGGAQSKLRARRAYDTWSAGASTSPLDVMSQEPLRYDAEATVTFLTAVDGGRSTPAFSGYRPQFHYAGADWDALNTYPDVTQVDPGDTVRVLLNFLSPDQHLGKVVVGTPFLLREGRRIVAYGSITKILDLESSARRARERHAV
jgi:elongation factor Tu-like protein